MKALTTIKTIKSKLVGSTIADVTIEKWSAGMLRNITLTLSNGTKISIDSDLVDDLVDYEIDTLTVTEVK